MSDCPGGGGEIQLDGMTLTIMYSNYGMILIHVKSNDLGNWFVWEWYNSDNFKQHGPKNGQVSARGQTFMQSLLSLFVLLWHG